MDKDTLVAILGPALVIGFIVIIVLCVIADKTANKRFDKKIKNKYKIKEQLGGMMVTENKELLMYLGSGTLHGYKLWNIEDIAYVGMDTIKTQATFSGVSFCFLDEKKKAMKGTYLTPSSKPLLQKKQVSFNADSEDVLYSIYDLLKKYNSNLQIIRNGDVVER